MKTRIGTKENDKISQADVEEVNKTITKIEQKQSSSSDKIISDSIFLDWSKKEQDKDQDIEYQAPIVKKELEMLYNRSKELNMLNALNKQESLIQPAFA